MLKIYYKVDCFYITKKPDHIHAFNIGIFESRERAQQAVEKIQDKPGFCEHKEKIKIKKRVRLTEPRLLNRIFWDEGFITYTYYK